MGVEFLEVLYYICSGAGVAGSANRSILSFTAFRSSNVVYGLVIPIVDGIPNRNPTISGAGPCCCEGRLRESCSNGEGAPIWREPAVLFRLRLFLNHKNPAQIASQPMIPAITLPIITAAPASLFAELWLASLLSSELLPLLVLCVSAAALLPLSLPAVAVTNASKDD